jgi:high affinity Mn2+ porin
VKSAALFRLDNGKVAVTGFLTRGRMGTFQDAIQLAALTGGPADVAAVRRYQSRGGISMNLEQQLMPNVGLFVRAGIADGRKEPYEFTDVDRTVAAGLSVSKMDTFGSGVVSSISTVHQAFLNAGGRIWLAMAGASRKREDYRDLYSFPVLAAKVAELNDRQSSVQSRPGSCFRARSPVRTQSSPRVRSSLICQKVSPAVESFP